MKSALNSSARAAAQRTLTNLLIRQLPIEQRDPNGLSIAECKEDLLVRHGVSMPNRTLLAGYRAKLIQCRADVLARATTSSSNITEETREQTVVHPPVNSVSSLLSDSVLIDLSSATDDYDEDREFVEDSGSNEEDEDYLEDIAKNLADEENNI